MKTGVACAVALGLGAITMGGAACVTSENRCVPGYVYVSEYRACTPVADAATDAATTDATTPSEAGDSDAGSGLGTDCSGDGDCAGKKASYCLKDPLSPDAPGICSVPQCSSTDCGDAYACCDCGSAAVPELQAWPRGVCVPQSDAPTVQSFGCVCP